ncbi:sulfite exporter TauE/SafE family protein [Rhodobacter sp. KR11]|uniref:sulfite exporter TauE/SafE family protein n=1 Tax=Rhodobacter sp. KR11 TaxID=2974588 RepID=UPI002223EC6A|nr:sulfite exporter TauE/SafE family protein [Rhodobacter sp. KR11]MCW1919274.1 sulfite exporter TauE/SafE family protein [Rhodobacter sp. KR11]
MAGLSPGIFAAALAVTLFAGFVKGVAGFAMPLIMMSAFSSFLPPQLALAGLILPTLLTNLSQAFRQGVAPAVQTARTYRRFLAATLVFIVISAQFVHVIPERAFLLGLGLPVTAFAVAQVMGLSLALPLRHRHGAEWALGAVGGLYGGVSGIWGPPLIVYLLSIKADKAETVRVQGVVFLMGAVVLCGAHLATGVLNAQTLGFSAVLALAAQLGQIGGNRLQDRLDAVAFRRWTQALLILTGLNLVRQALMG